MEAADPEPHRTSRQALRRNRSTEAATGATGLPPSKVPTSSPMLLHAPKAEEAVGLEIELAAWDRPGRARASPSLLPLVATTLAQRVMQRLQCAYASRRWGVRPPVLLHGPPGSGKSSYIRWLAQSLGMRQSPVCLFLDQQSEPKDLVGSWVCGRRAGEFEWQEGILARCVREGRWVVIEQLQQLAHDVHALLHGLASTGVLTIHEQQRRVRAHPDFALFATLASPPTHVKTVSQKHKGKQADANDKANVVAVATDPEVLDVALTRPPPQLPPLLESWVLLHVPAPSAADVLHISSQAFPTVAPIVSRLLRAFHAASSVAMPGIARPGQPPAKAVRHPQLRDFLKLCRRLERLANGSGFASFDCNVSTETNSSCSSSTEGFFRGFLTDCLKLRIVEEGATVLLSHINDLQLRFQAAVAFAAEWGVQEDQVKALLFAQVPTIWESADALHVGPYALPKLGEKQKPKSRSGELDNLLSTAADSEASDDVAREAAAAAAPKAEKAGGTEFLTGQQVRLLQQAAGALCCGEPILFVGDTGAGKTFIVSFVAARIGVKLVVANLHQQSESEDLLGRWVPRHPPQEAEKLWAQLFQISEDMLGPLSPPKGNEEGAETPQSKKRKQPSGGLGDSLIEATRLMVSQVQQRGARLLQRESYVSLLRLSLAATNALLHLLRKRGDRLPVVRLRQPQQQNTASELLVRCKKLHAAASALLNDPALRDCSAAPPRSFESIVEACGLKEFLPAEEAPAPAGVEGAPRRRPKCQLHFAFTEGPLVEAVRTGKWLLLDEINLAPPDLLQRLLGLLDDPDQPLLVLEGGRQRLVARHPNFRVFACMNPPTLAPPLRLAEQRLSFEDEKDTADASRQRQAQQEEQQDKAAKLAREPAQDGAYSAAVGKRNLPAEVRQRFTELYVDETDGLEDIAKIANAHLRRLSADPPSRLVAEVYIHIRCLAEGGQLLDGNNKTPCYSLRTLSRALLHAKATAQRRMKPLQLRSALREGFSALFGSSLDQQSSDRVESVLAKAFCIPRQTPATTGSDGARTATEVAVELFPALPGEQEYVGVEGFLIRRGTEKVDMAALKKSFVSTPRTQAYLRRIVRLLSGSRCALLLEGPTSCGKTSLVFFLAAATGHKCVRINNHEHTDIQEYIGSYAPDAAGRLVFTEGPLTLAVRHGWWVLIDELNLASSEVLEALNRLLDSNRELLLPPTGEVIKAHPDFQLFGTQNPAGLGVYGGRKALSKALANRFLQLQLEEFGIEDLRLILTNRCKLPASRAEPMLKVFRDLQQRRSRSLVFFGLHGFMTIRDLIRWGRRVGSSPFQQYLQQEEQQQQQVHEFAPTSMEEVALEGWLLVGERLRTDEEKAIVKESLEKHCLKSTPSKPRLLVVNFATDPYVAAFRRLLEAKMGAIAQLQHAAAAAAAAAAVAANKAASLKKGPEAARREAEATAATAAAAAQKAARAAPELPAFLPFSFNAASLRLLALTLRALAASENLLLVGETGTGKTAVCELVAWTLQPNLQQQLQQQAGGEERPVELEHLLLQRFSPSGMYAYNCHLQMEASELLGCMHPVHQGEQQQQQQQALASQAALLQLLEEPPAPDHLLPNWQQQLHRRSATTAAGEKTTKPTGACSSSTLKRRCSAAQGRLERFHKLLQEAAADVLICLRASRGRSQQQQQPLHEDVGLFTRALRKAAKVSVQILEKEIKEEMKKALQRETQLQAQVLAAEERLQQHQEKLQRLQQQAVKQKPSASSVEQGVAPEQQRQEDTVAGRKRQRKGCKRNASQNVVTAAEKAAQKRRRKKTESAGSVYSEVVDREGGKEATETPAATVAAVEEAKRTVEQQVALLAAAVGHKEDIELAGEAVAALVGAFSQLLRERCSEWKSAYSDVRHLFRWRDGPLVKAMKEGAIFLLDEVSLAQDAVLERLNSVLEDGKHLLLTEQGVTAADLAAAAGEDGGAAATGVVDIVAAAGFRFIATMNPGGDYGKRELSPALRNRLTEVYVPAFSFDTPDAALLLLQRLQYTPFRGLDLPHAVKAAAHVAVSQEQQLLQQEREFLLQQQKHEGSAPDVPLTLLAQRLVVVLRWVRRHIRQPLSIRDAFCWICFLARFLCSQRAAHETISSVAAAATAAKWAVQGFVHGGCLLLLDGLGVGAEMQLTQAQLKTLADDYLSAERDLLANAKPTPPQHRKQNKRLKLLQQRLQQELEAAAEQPERLPHLAILLLLKTQACRLYRDLGLHNYETQEEGQKTQNAEYASGPSWSDTCAAFERDGFAWVAQAFTEREERVGMHSLEGKREADDLQIGPFSLAAFRMQATDARTEKLQQQQKEESLPQVADSPSVQRSLGRLLRCLLLVQQQQQEGGAAYISKSSSSGRHAVLLEGPPGAGKTFVVNLLARLCGRRLVRINLSEDTELADLVGSFIPAADDDWLQDDEAKDGAAAAQKKRQKQGRPPFVWADGVLTRHLRAGDWVLLDELNLAPQQTLEGLNPLLDHRRCVYLPTSGDPCSSSSSSDASKGAVVCAPPGFVLFATQNPHAATTSVQSSATMATDAATPQLGGGCQQQQDTLEAVQLLGLPSGAKSGASRRSTTSATGKAVGGRKGLPQSLLNRFCRIRVDEMLESDMVAIAHNLFRCLQDKQQHQPSQQSGESRAKVLVKQKENKKIMDSRRAMMLSVCAVRCVRLMGELAAEKPFEGLGNTTYNLRDVTRVIHLLANNLPCANPRASAAIALLSRLRCRADMAPASRLLMECFPSKLEEFVGQQNPEQLQHLQQQPKALDAVSALLCASVAPAAVLAATKSWPLEAAEQIQGGAGAALPLDLLLEGDGRVSLGGMLLSHKPAAAAASVQQEECGEEEKRQENVHSALLLHSQRRCVATVAAAITVGFPVLLTGERGGGKSSIVRWLAAAWNVELCEVQLAPSIDTSDLLGSYRQIQPRQRVLQATQFADETAQLLLGSLQQQQTNANNSEAIAWLEGHRAAAAAARDQLAKWGVHDVAADTEKAQDPSAEMQQGLLQRLSTATAAVIDGCEAAATLLAHQSHQSTSTREANKSVLQVHRRCSQARRLLRHGCALGGLLANATDAANTSTGEEEKTQFEWVDSSLVAAVREGRWLLLKDAHLCSPSVLDRLNSLLEDDGALLLTEGGSPRLVKKHQGFRVVLTADASRAHMLSSALRNRCCEVYVPPPGAGAPLEAQTTGTSNASPGDITSKITGVTTTKNGNEHVFETFACSVSSGKRRALLQGLTDRVLQTLSRQLRVTVVSLEGAAGSTGLDALLLRWIRSLLSEEGKETADAEAAVATALATVQVLGVFIGYSCYGSQRSSRPMSSTNPGGSTKAVRAPVRLCPLLLQDGYRLLLTGAAGTLATSAAEVMALHHAALQVLVQLLGDDQVLASFARRVEAELWQQKEAPERRQEQRGFIIHTDVDLETDPIGNLKRSLGEEHVLIGLHGLQSLARRVSGGAYRGAAAAAAANWRCLQGWGSAYIAAVGSFSTWTKGTDPQTNANLTIATPLSRAAGAISFEKLFQCFLWQYTAALDSSATWRVVLLHLLAACCRCCFSTSTSQPMEVAQGINDSNNRDWVILRDAIERHALAQTRRSGCSLMARCVSSEVAFLGGVFAEATQRAGRDSFSLAAAATRHFLWGAENQGALLSRLEVLAQLQLQQQQRVAHQYLTAACNTIRQLSPDALLLPPTAATAAATFALGVTPAKGLSLLYAAARLAKASKNTTSTSVVLLQQLVRLVCLSSTALLLPERLLLLQQETRSRRKDANAAINATACPGCGGDCSSDASCCFLILLGEHEQQQWQGLVVDVSQTVHATPQLMQRIFDSLMQLANESVTAAGSLLLSSSNDNVAASVAAAGQTEQCRHLARCFRSWIAMLQLLCIPLCWRCQGDVDTEGQQQSNSNSKNSQKPKHLIQKIKMVMRALGERLALRVKALAANLRDFVAANQRTAAALGELQGYGDLTVESTATFVSGELLVLLHRLHAELTHGCAQGAKTEVIVDVLAAENVVRPSRGQQHQPDGLPAEALLNFDVSSSSSTSWSLLPTGVGEQNGQSICCWLLREILQAAALGLGAPADFAAAAAAVGAAEGDAVAASTNASRDQQRALLQRRFATSLPSLTRAYDLLKLAAGSSKARQQQQQHQQENQLWSKAKLPQPRELLPHASALLALLMSSSHLRAEGRTEAASMLERQVLDVLLPPLPMTPVASFSCPLRSNASATGAAVRAAAEAEGLTHSRHQRWATLSGVAVLTVSLLQAQLATEAALRLGMAHAVFLLLHFIRMQQVAEAAAAGDKGVTPCTAILPLGLELAVKAQLLRQQQDVLPLFTCPAAAYASSNLGDLGTAARLSGSLASIPVPPALHETAALLTVNAWHQRQQQKKSKNSNHTELAQLKLQIAAAASAALEALCCMWRTELDIHCNDALGLQAVLQLQQQLQDDGAASLAETATTAGVTQPMAVLSQQLWGSLAEVAGGLRGAGGAAMLFKCSSVKAKEGGLTLSAVGCSSAYTARILVEVQQHATVASASACFIALQRLRRQLKLLDNDSRPGVSELWYAREKQEQTEPRDAETTAVVATDKLMTSVNCVHGEHAEWEAVFGFFAVLLSFCRPPIFEQKETNSTKAIMEEPEQTDNEKRLLKKSQMPKKLKQQKSQKDNILSAVVACSLSLSGVFHDCGVTDHGETQLGIVLSSIKERFSASATATNATGDTGVRLTQEASRTALACFSLLHLLMCKCNLARDPATLVKGFNGSYWRGILLLLLGRWAVLAAAAAAEADLKERRAVVVWRQTVSDDVSFYEAEREALLLRCVALDGCDGQESVTPCAGACTSASAALAKEAEEHASALQQLLLQSQTAAAPQQDASRFLPLRSEGIPAELALRLAKYNDECPTANTIVSTESDEGIERARLQVLQCVRQRALVDAAEEEALNAWLEEMMAFINSTLDAKRLSTQLPDLLPFLVDEKAGEGKPFSGVPAVSAAALRTEAHAAAACSSRLAAAHPLLCATATRTASTGLLAVAKGLLCIAGATGALQQQQQKRQQRLQELHKKYGAVIPDGAEHIESNFVKSMRRILRNTVAFPLLPFAAVDSGAVRDWAVSLQQVQRVQWLLLWLRAEATGVAATAAACCGSKADIAAASESPRSTAFAPARLALASMLQQMAQRHLAWRRKQEIAADKTATLLQRLEGLVVDRSTTGDSRADADAAKEFFPCSDEWGGKELQQQQQLLQEEAPTDGSTQYTRWCQPARGIESEDTPLQQKQQLAPWELEGLSEADLLHVWGRAVDVGLAWNGSTSGKDGDLEAVATSAYREALAMHDDDESTLNTSEKRRAPDGRSVPQDGDAKCAPHLQAMLMQASARFIDSSPVQLQQQDQILQRLLLQDDEEAAEAKPQAGDSASAAEGATAAIDVNDKGGLTQQLQQERLQLQRERARKLRFKELCRCVSLRGTKDGSGTGAATSFYAPGNPVLLQPLCRPVQLLQEAAAAFVAIVDEHPALQGVLLLAQRVSSLSLSGTSAADALAALEGLLDRADSWQKAIDRHHLAHLISVHFSAAASRASRAAAAQQQPTPHDEKAHGRAETSSGPSSIAAMQQQEQAAMEASQNLIKSFEAAVRSVERQVLLLRKRQLLEWRYLRDFREQRVHQQSLHFAPFLWALLPDDGDTAKPPRAAAAAAAAAVVAVRKVLPTGDWPQGVAGALLLHLIRAAPVAVTDVLLRFLRTAPLGEFEGRLRCMEAASQSRRMLLHAAEAEDVSLHVLIEGEATEKFNSEAGSSDAAAAHGTEIVGSTMGAVARFAVAAGWHRAVQQQLRDSRKSMDIEVRALANLTRWNLSSRVQMKESVHKTHVQLAKHVRKFDGSLLQLTEAAISPFQGQLQQQLVAAALSLPLQSPLAIARQTADTHLKQEQQEQQEQQEFEILDAAAAAAREAVQEFLKQVLGPEMTGKIEAATLADLYPFSNRSASPTDVALDVQSFCQDFISTVKLAASDAARNMEEQRQQRQKERGDEPERLKKKKPVTRQQMQRRFTELRSVLRSTLKLPCLSMCGGAPGLLAAALNDASGLPGPPEYPHPLQQAAALYHHDISSAAAVALFHRSKKKAGGVSNAAIAMPLADLLGPVWSSAARQWYLLLQMLLQCQQFPSPHKDVAGERDALLGFAAAFVLHVLQQRDRCWRGAAEYQELADAAAVCLVSSSVVIYKSTVSNLVSAVETVEQGLLQARAVLPCEREAIVQNEALQAQLLPPEKQDVIPESLAGPDSPLGTEVPATRQDECGLLQHNVRKLREAHNTINAGLRMLQPLQQLLQHTPEARRLAAAPRCGNKVDDESWEDNMTLRVRLQWTERVGAACTKAQRVLKDIEDETSSLFRLLPVHAVAGLVSACDSLRQGWDTLKSHAEKAEREERSQLVPAVQNLVAALSGCNSRKEVEGKDSLLQLNSVPDDEGEEFQQPAFDTLPVPPLTTLFAFRDVINAINTFDREAPKYVPSLLKPINSSPSGVVGPIVVRMLQRAAGVILAVFDGLEGTARLGLSFLQLVLLLLQLGWGCVSNEDEAAAAVAAAQPQKQKDEWVAGTGLGEGEGAKDASDQIEEEWQFDGLKDEKSDPHQKPPEKPKAAEEDVAMEVSMDFEGEEQAPPLSKQEEDEQHRRHDEGAQQMEDSVGPVDLKEGGKLEKKRWAGNEEDQQNDGDSKGQSKGTEKEEIHTEGGVREGGVQMEGAKNVDQDLCDDSKHEKEEKGQQDQKQGAEQQPKETGEEEDAGQLKGSVEDGNAQEEESAPVEYYQKLQKGDGPEPGEAGETPKEDVADKGASEEGNETGDGAAAEHGDPQQQKQQQMSGEGPSDGWGDGVQLEEDIVLDEDGDEQSKRQEDRDIDAGKMGNEAKAEVSADAATAAGADANSDPGASKDDGCNVEEVAFDGADQQQQQNQEEGCQQDATAEDESAQGDNSGQPAEEHSSETPEEGKKCQQNGVEASDGEAKRDLSVQGLAAPLIDGTPAEDEQQQERCQQEGKQHKEDRIAFGIEGIGSVVQQEQMEGETDGGTSTREDTTKNGAYQEGDATAAASAEGGALARSDADAPHQRDTSSRRNQLPQNLLPDNPLEDASAAERWLQRVHLLQENAWEEDTGAAEAGDPQQMGVDGEGADGGGGGEGDRAEQQAVESRKVCQIDEAAGNQEAFAEASEAAAAKPASNAKLADAENKEKKDHEKRHHEQNEEQILSTVHCAEPLPKPSPVKKLEANPLEERGIEPQEVISSGDSEDGLEKQENSKQLFQSLSAESSTTADTGTQQLPERSFDILERRKAEDAWEKLEAMKEAFQAPIILEDLGKKGLSPEHAAALWHLLEGRTAASAAALSESLRLVLQPTTARAWEGGYRSGKKLSLRRVLAFIASSERDDRLWLRRRRPRGLQYRVLVGIDCTKSMQELNAGASALEAVVLLAQAFNHAQIGTVSVCTFGGKKPEVCVHPTPQLSASDGQRLLQRCSFAEESHKSHEVAISDLLQLAIHELEQDSSTSDSSNNLILILSDGRFNKEQTRPWVNTAILRRCIPVLLILDPQHQPQQQGEAGGVTAAASPKPSAFSTSIFDLKQVQQQTRGGIEVKPYLEDFPFPYYAVVNDTAQLPSVLADIIRQWVEAAANDW